MPKNINKITRRRFLTGAAATGLCLSPALSAFLSAAKKEKQPFKYGVCDWSIGAQQDVRVFELAREVGLDGVEVSFDGGPKFDLRDDAVRRQYLDAAKKYDVDVCSMAMGVLNNVPFATDARTQQWVLEAVEVMPKLGVDTVLLPFFFAGEIIGDAKLQANVVNNLKKVAPAAEKAGVTFSLETSLSGDDDMRIIDSVGSPAVKIYYDVSNKLRRGYDIYKDIPRMKKYFNRIHMKEKENKLLGEGIVDFPRVRDLLAEIGYRGWLVIEAATIEGHSEVKCHKKNLKYLQSLFTQV